MAMWLLPYPWASGEDKACVVLNEKRNPHARPFPVYPCVDLTALCLDLFPIVQRSM